tara:strand:+ start:2766 stop:3038 length:273 start_codon:yes stop_codon:yes gene_type:complete
VRIANLEIGESGKFTYHDTERGIDCSANFPLYLIRRAWDVGMDVEDLADGYGPGCGTMGGDWSGIRDSSNEAKAKMLERTLNFLEEVITK